MDVYGYTCGSSPCPADPDCLNCERYVTQEFYAYGQAKDDATVRVDKYYFMGVCEIGKDLVNQRYYVLHKPVVQPWRPSKVSSISTGSPSFSSYYEDEYDEEYDEYEEEEWEEEELEEEEDWDSMRRRYGNSQPELEITPEDLYSMGEDEGTYEDEEEWSEEYESELLSDSTPLEELDEAFEAEYEDYGVSRTVKVLNAAEENAGELPHEHSDDQGHAAEEGGHGKSVVEHGKHGKSVVEDGKHGKSVVEDGKHGKSVVEDWKHGKSVVEDGKLKKRKSLKSVKSTTSRKVIHGRKSAVSLGGEHKKRKHQKSTTSLTSRASEAHVHKKKKSRKSRHSISSKSSETTPTPHRVRKKRLRMKQMSTQSEPEKRHMSTATDHGEHKSVGAVDDADLPHEKEIKVEALNEPEPVATKSNLKPPAPPPIPIPVENPIMKPAASLNEIQSDDRKSTASKTSVRKGRKSTVGSPLHPKESTHGGAHKKPRKSMAGPAHHESHHHPSPHHHEHHHHEPHHNEPQQPEPPREEPPHRESHAKKPRMSMAAPIKLPKLESRASTNRIDENRASSVVLQPPPSKFDKIRSSTDLTEEVRAKRRKKRQSKAYDRSSTSATSTVAVVGDDRGKEEERKRAKKKKRHHHHHHRTTVCEYRGAGVCMNMVRSPFAGAALECISDHKGRHKCNCSSFAETFLRPEVLAVLISFVIFLLSKAGEVVL